MATAENLNRGRDAFLRCAWTDAYLLLTAADDDEPLQPDDLERLATAAYLIGKDRDSARLWTRAHNVFLNTHSLGSPKMGGPPDVRPIPPSYPRYRHSVATGSHGLRGRHDRADRLRIARQTSARYGWPLRVIENCADDPPRYQPRAFLARFVRSESQRSRKPRGRRLS